MATLSTARRAKPALRAFCFLSAVALVVTACGGSAAPTTSTMSPGTTTTEPADTVAPATTASAPTTSSPATTIALPTTTNEPSLTYTVAGQGTGAVSPLPGSDGMLGSGCTPGPGALTDGIWFGWIDAVVGAGVSFDLACLAAGDPAIAGNSNPALRDIVVASAATVHRADGSMLDFSSFAPSDDPLWVYINNGLATEFAYPTINITMDPGAQAWIEADVNLPNGGGCCGEMYTGTPSPDEPWSPAGLPADGVYGLDLTVDYAANALVVQIRKFVSCDERPEICIADYREGDLALEWDGHLSRTIPLDNQLTVRLMGIQFDPAIATDIPQGIEGDGTAFSTLLADSGAAFEKWIRPELDAGSSYEDITTMIVEHAGDESFPFVVSRCCGDDWGPAAYRGPHGIELIAWLYEPNDFLGPSQLVVHNGKPILIMDAGRFAG